MLSGPPSLHKYLQLVRLDDIYIKRGIYLQWNEQLLYIAPDKRLEMLFQVYFIIIRYLGKVTDSILLKQEDKLEVFMLKIRKKVLFYSTLQI